MKKILIAFALLCLCTLIGCNAGGNAEESSVKSGAEEDSAPEATLSEETMNQATTEEITTEEETTERPILTAEEHRAEINRKTYGGRVTIGGYTTPGDMNVTETAFRNLLSAGVNTMVTGNEFYGQVMITNTLRIADELGMDIAIQAYGQIYSRDDLVDKLKLSYDHPSVKYVYLCDEPIPDLFSSLAKKTSGIRDAYGEDRFIIGSNMYPAGVLDNLGGWYTCSRNYIDKSKSDFLCFDSYPWRTHGNYMDDYLATVVMEKSVCDEYGIEMLTFLQTSGWDDATLPTEGQLRFQTNVTLALGADGMFCFMCCDSTSERLAMIKPDGTPDDFYYVCDSVFNDVHAMNGVFLPYDTEKMIVIGEPQLAAAMAKKDENLIITEPAYGSLKNLTGNRVMVGYMKNADGKEGFYVVNSDWSNEDTVTLEFDGQHTYQLWNGNGLEKMGTADSITVGLVPGGACFIALDLSLDSYDYAEPDKPVHTPVELPTAKQGDLIFDLGFDGDGNIYNKAENSVTTKSICSGKYGEMSGVTALNKYDIYTTEIYDGSKYGVTTEMYIYLTDNADKKWVTFFYDICSNNNLHRLFEKSNGAYVGSIYQGSYSDADNVIEDTEKVKSILPTGQWLHIVSTVSEKGQYLYVNGKQVMEAHNPNNAPLTSCFKFTDGDGVCYLNTARIYAYAATAEQVSEMYKNIR